MLCLIAGLPFAQAAKPAGKPAAKLETKLAAAPVVLTVEMKNGRVLANGEIVENEKESDFPKTTIRLRNSDVGRVFLLKAKASGDYLIFGRKVSLEKDGQYLARGNKDKKVETATAAGTSEDKWTELADVTAYFTTLPAAQKEDIIPLPPDTPNLTTLGDKGNLSSITDKDLPPRLLKSAPPDMQAGYGLSIPTTGFGRPPLSPAPTARPRAGAEAYVYEVEEGKEPGYGVQPGDTLDIVFYRVQRVTVDLKGDIRIVSAVGKAESIVPAAGKTPEDIARAVADSGLNFSTLTSPAIRVAVSKFAESSAIVLGSVEKPGRLTVETDMFVGLKEILERAGGLAIPERSAVLFIRRGERVTKIDMEKTSKSSIEKFDIKPGDIITVTKK